MVNPNDQLHRVFVGSAEGRLRKAHLEELARRLHGASVITRVSRCRHGRLVVTLTEWTPEAAAAVDTLVEAYQGHVERLAHRRDDKNNCLALRRGRKDKKILREKRKDKPTLHEREQVEYPWVRELLDGVEFEGFMLTPTLSLL